MYAYTERFFFRPRLAVFLMSMMRSVLLVGITTVAIAGCGPASQPEVAATSSAPPPLPTFVKHADWGDLPNGWIFGSVSGVAADSQGKVWVLHRPRSVPVEDADRAAPPVVVFDLEGNFVDAWGGPATNYEWPQNEHGIHIDNDGFVWISGNYCTAIANERLESVDDDQVLKLTQDGELVRQIGRASQSGGNADTENFHRPAAMAVHAPTNELFVADGYGNHRVIVLDAETGAFRRMWGAFGRTPIDDDRCGPSFVGPDAPPWNTDQFSIVHGIDVSDDGLVYVADRENGRVQVFTLSGEYLAQVDLGPDANPMTVAFSADEEQRYLFTWSAGQIHVHDRQSLDLLTVIDDDPSSRSVGHLMATDSQGNIYLARLDGGIEKLVLTGAATR